MVGERSTSYLCDAPRIVSRTNQTLFYLLDVGNRVKSSFNFLENDSASSSTRTRMCHLLFVLRSLPRQPFLQYFGKIRRKKLVLLICAIFADLFAMFYSFGKMLQ